MQMKQNLILAIVTAAVFSLGLWAAQATSQKNMNDWSYSKVKRMMSNPKTAKEVGMMARKNGVMLMGACLWAGRP